MDDLKNHPLFIDDPNKLNFDSPEIEALRALKYSEPPETLQENFYKEGNKMLREKILIKNPIKDEQKYYLKRAIVSYSEGLQ